MPVRSNRFWVLRMAAVVVSTALVGTALAANSLPLAREWNITCSGEASSTGELLFRVSGEGGRDPDDVTVVVLSGSSEAGVADRIRKALSTQLDPRRFEVQAGDSANVVLTADGRSRGFSVELIESDVDGLRVTVQSTTPVAPPTVPPQRAPANPPATPRTPPAPGDAAPPEATPPEATPPASDGAGAAASAPPPPGTD